MATSVAHELLDNRADYDTLAATIQNIHQIAAPGCKPGFSTAKLRYSNADHSYFYFPHPAHREEILRFAHTLAYGADNVERSLIVPRGILAGHMFNDGNGRASRRTHAILLGKDSADIAKLKIDGGRRWLGIDKAAQAVIDLSTPAALAGHLESYVYETTGTAKHIDLSKHMVTTESIEAYKALQVQLPEKFREDLSQTVIDVVPFNKRSVVYLLDAESASFALNAQRSDNEAAPEGKIDLTAALANLDEAGLMRFTEDVWRYRLLRAKASIACLAQTALGSRIVALPDHRKPMSLRDHYIRLSNNLLSPQS